MRALPKGILVSLCAAALVCGCNDRNLRPLTPCTTAGVSQAVPIDDVKNVDLLFMVDNSGSMREEQTKLRREFPRMVRALVTGDIDGDGTVDGPAVSSLRVGVITSDLGVGGTGTTVGQFAIQSCGADPAAPGGVNFGRAHYGDDGVLRSTGTSLTSVPADPDDIDCDVDGTPGDDSVTSAALPAYLTFDGAMAGDTAAVNEYARRVSCLANAGTAGCAFEQQLESVLKAITPGNDPPTTGGFHFAPGDDGRGLGHGCQVFLPDGSCDLAAQGADVVNAGWFRSDSLFAIVVISDEDDCSASDPAVFDFTRTTGTYVDPFAPFQSQTRCQRYADDLVHPIDRYIQGILKRRETTPSRIVYAVITGVPPTLTDEEDEGTDNIQAILDDSSMQVTFVAEVKNAGPGGTPLLVPDTNVAEVCHHTVPQISTAGTGRTTAGSMDITNVTLAGAVVPFVGMGISGSTIAAGSLVTAVSGSGPYDLTLDEPAIGTSPMAGVAINGLTFDGAATGDLNSTATVTNFTMANGARPVIGMTLTGAGLPANVRISNVIDMGATYNLSLSAAATATSAGTAITVRLLDVSAVPARRIVGVARGLQTASQNQVNSIVQSICVDDFRPAVQRILRLIQANLAGSCLPRSLIRNALNQVNCGVFVTLPAGQTCEDAAFAGVYDTSKSEEVTIGAQTRWKCAMIQVPVEPTDVTSGAAPAVGTGWYYDDYTADIETCSSPQRISFTTTAKPPEGSIMDFGCTQPVQDGDLALDIGNACTCEFPTAEDEAAFVLRYNLPASFSAVEDFVCEFDSNTCQIRCETDADCPGGFVCYDDLADDDAVQATGQSICVNPTCGSGF